MTLMAEEITGMYASLSGPEQYLVHDMKFHQTVAAASNNRILTSLMNMIATILFDTRGKTVHRALDLKQSAGAASQYILCDARAYRRCRPAGDARSPHRNKKAQRLEELDRCKGRLLF